MKFKKKGMDIGFILGETGKIIIVVLFLIAILAVILIFFKPTLIKALKWIDFW